jgi:hypothetical protein
MRRLRGQPDNDEAEGRHDDVARDLRQLLVDVLREDAVLLAQVPHLQEAVLAAGEQQLPAATLHRVNLCHVVAVTHQLEECLVGQQVINDNVGVLRA